MRPSDTLTVRLALRFALRASRLLGRGLEGLAAARLTPLHSTMNMIPCNSALSPFELYFEPVDFTV